LDAGYDEESINMLSNACELYKTWGSSPKVEQIHNLHPKVNPVETSASHFLSMSEESVDTILINRAAGATIISDLTFDNFSRTHS